MANVVPQLIEDIQYLGMIYAEIEQQFKECDYEETLTAFFPILEQTHAEHFRTQSAPDGTPWPPLSDRTVKRKKHDRILFQTGRLRSSLIGNTSDTVRAVSERGQGLLFGTAVEYAGFHDKGSGRLPQRQHVGMVDETLQILVDSVADKTVEALKFTL